MTRLHFHLTPEQMPDRASSDERHVFLYGPQPVHKGTGSIGNQARSEMARLGTPPRAVAVDFLSIALAVTAADTFVLRSEAADSWSRTMEIDLPLHRPAIWESVRRDLELTLSFLSGDQWRFSFRDGGRPPPTQFEVKTLRHHLDLSRIDYVSLFSGGLDSGVAALLALNAGARPLLVSHAYTGDAGYQIGLADQLKGAPQRFALNANPEMEGAHEESMRSRSFNFLAFGTLAADTAAGLKGGLSIDLHVPENGLIALNAPLTPRRTGTLSTRTTHPHFLSSMQSIFDRVGLRARVFNPYELFTKGEMVCLARDLPEFERIASLTVSCGKWKRANKQCGRCVPCLIRRASLYAAAVDDKTDYVSPDLAEVQKSQSHRDDLSSMMTAVLRAKSVDLLPRWVAQTGPLPLDPKRRAALIEVHRRGLAEVGAFLSDTGFSL
jgi:hypothetical protein